MSPLEQYQHLLATHDWFYDYSDDYSVWKRGQEHAAKIAALGRQVDPTGQIRADYYNTHIKKG